MTDTSKSDLPGERIAKVMARAGLASRRQAEAWIAEGRVAVNGAVISSPALNITAADKIVVDGKPMPRRERTRMFLYNKPRGLVTTHSDPEGRPTIFTALPPTLPRLISVGRLDINTEGLLLLTNDGGLARVLELPATAWLRKYRVRANGSIDQAALDTLRAGVTVDGVRYGPIEAKLDRQQGANVWLTFAIREGKNREIRKVLESLGLRVNRLIRISFGPFNLGELPEWSVKEIDSKPLRAELGEKIVAQANADFDAPIIDHEEKVEPRREDEEKSSGRPLRGQPPPRGRDHENDSRERHDSPHHSETRARDKSPRHSGAGRRAEPGIQKRNPNSRLDSGAPLRGSRNDEQPVGAPDRNNAKKFAGRDGKKESSSSRNFKKRAKRRDRTGGPRPKYPKA